MYPRVTYSKFWRLFNLGYLFLTSLLMSCGLLKYGNLFFQEISEICILSFIRVKPQFSTYKGVNIITFHYSRILREKLCQN